MVVLTIRLLVWCSISDCDSLDRSDRLIGRLLRNKNTCQSQHRYIKTGHRTGDGAGVIFCEPYGGLAIMMTSPSEVWHTILWFIVSKYLKRHFDVRRRANARAASDQRGCQKGSQEEPRSPRFKSRGLSGSDPLPIDFVLDKRLWISWFPRFRYCGRRRNFKFRINILEEWLLMIITVTMLFT